MLTKILWMADAYPEGRVLGARAPWVKIKKHKVCVYLKQQVTKNEEAQKKILSYINDLEQNSRRHNIRVFGVKDYKKRIPMKSLRN